MRSNSICWTCASTVAIYRKKWVCRSCYRLLMLMSSLITWKEKDFLTILRELRKVRKKSPRLFSRFSCFLVL